MELGSSTVLANKLNLNLSFLLDQIDELKFFKCSLTDLNLWKITIECQFHYVFIEYSDAFFSLEISCELIL